MRTIVVASDAPSVRRELSSVLQGSDTEILELQTGQEVTEAARDRDLDLVIVDLQMGSMGGMAVCLDLRLDESMGASDHVPVLMLLDRRADVFLARRSSAEGWLVKPLDPLRIRRAATRLLDGGNYHDESYQPVPVLVPGGQQRPGTGGRLDQPG